MHLRVQADSSVPIYEQITRQVVYVIAAGDLAVGELIPSVRDLSQQLIVNANTVARAFTELERAGILESRRGLGMAVAPEAPARCRERRKEQVRERVRESVREAVSAGLTVDELVQLAREEWPADSARGVPV